MHQACPPQVEIYTVEIPLDISYTPQSAHFHRV